MNLTAVGSYDLLEIIGFGGMSTVYKGRHRPTGRVVAVKVVQSELITHPVLLQRFRQEFQAIRQLQHPHIVAGVDFGMDEEIPFLVMEYVAGESLGSWIRREGPLPNAEAIRLARQIGGALHCAHELHLLHRDVKPENIILAAGGQAKLTDLGLVKFSDQEHDLTRSQVALGTFAYMAPEQFEDAKNVDRRCDIYGLGATLYHAVTGKQPFPGSGHLTILKKKLANDFAPPLQLMPTLNKRLNAAICSALEASIDLRPPTFADFLELLPPQEASAFEMHIVPASHPISTPASEVDPESPSADERRLAQRFPSILDTRCRPLSGRGETWPGQILDISQTGVRMALTRRFEPGTMLYLIAQPPDAVESTTWMVKVCWVREDGADAWQLGGQFHKALTENDLQALVTGNDHTVHLTE